MSREVMKMALEALEGLYAIVEIHQEATDNRFAWAEMPDAEEAIITLCNLLTKSEPEPVAWINATGDYCQISRPDTVYGSHTIPLYCKEDL